MEKGSMIEAGKLTQRELLILLNSKVEGIESSIGKLGEDYISLHTRVTKIETRIKVVAGVWGAVGTVVGIILSVIFKFI